MKILSATQTRNVDSYTIDHEPVASIDLMERAADAFTAWFIARFGPRSKVCIICGTGNNGGDGLAISRLLTQKNYTVEVLTIKISDNASDDFKRNEQRIPSLTTLKFIHAKDDIPDFHAFDIIIDAIFGSGLSRTVEGLYADVIEAINATDKITVSVDIASGLFADGHSVPGAIVKADHTVTFQFPKMAFFMPENAEYVGRWHIVDIGLMKEAVENQDSSTYMLTAGIISKLLKPRKKFSHKGTHGRALIMAGSYGKMGAAVLCARAALRTGVGLLTMNIPGCGYSIMQSVVPEAMVIADEGDHYLTSYVDMAGYDAVGIGPGIGLEQETVYSLMQTVQSYGKPMVIDADGLNIIAEHREIIEILPKNTILTPHPKEFERLVGTWTDDYERLSKQREFSRQHGLIIIFKGAHTTVSLPSGEVYFNSTGNPGMAVGGMGDVLTGMVVSLVAQKYSPEDAAK
ncbi:MAG: NAD(P)H-hydrate dehydratase, partial [Fulvivirga sp.]